MENGINKQAALTYRRRSAPVQNLGVPISAATESIAAGHHGSGEKELNRTADGLLGLDWIGLGIRTPPRRTQIPPQKKKTGLGEKEIRTGPALNSRPGWGRGSVGRRPLTATEEPSGRRLCSTSPAAVRQAQQIVGSWRREKRGAREGGGIGKEPGNPD
jgi:hypothetical protein